MILKKLSKILSLTLAFGVNTASLSAVKIDKAENQETKIIDTEKKEAKSFYKKQLTFYHYSTIMKLKTLILCFYALKWREKDG